MNYLKHFNPSVLLGDRLELTLYGMFVEAHLNNHMGIEKDIYEKFIGNFPGEIKDHTAEHFIKLIDNIKTNGFDYRYPIFANPDEYCLLNGSHRCAIAIQLGIANIPFVFRILDDRVDDGLYEKILGGEWYTLLKKKRDEYISRCEPASALACKIRMHMREHSRSFAAPFSSQTLIPVLRLYQSSKKIGIKGKRPSEKRLNIYGISQVLTPHTRVLEIGCNVGFFSLATSPLVASVTAFDIDPNYITIAEMVRNHQNIQNCTFSTASIHDFEPNDVYDFVISAAIHGWTQLPFGQYVTKLANWVRPGGFILFESHELDAEQDWLEKRSFLKRHFDVFDSGIIDDVDSAMYQSEFREYLILIKRQDYDYSLLEFILPPTQASPSQMSAVSVSRNNLSTSYAQFIFSLKRTGTSSFALCKNSARYAMTRLRAHFIRI